MKRLLTAGIFGTILGIVGAGTANASIVSSGFLDEKLTEYALSTSLDLKANQSDFTELNTQITNSIDNLKSLWNSEIGMLADGFNPNKVNNDIEGAFGLVGGFIIHSMESLTRGWYESRDNFYQGIRQLNDGWTDSNDGTTYLGVKDLNTKTGSYYWGPENEKYKFSNIPYFEELFSGLSPDKSLAMSDMATNILVNYTQPDFPGLAGVTNRLLNGWGDENRVLANPGLMGMYEGWIDSKGDFLPGLNFISNVERNVTDSYDGQNTARLLTTGAKATTIDGVDYTGPVYPLWKLSEGIDKIDSIETKIGTLPSGVAPMLSGPLLENFNSHHIFPFDATYPQSLEELIIDLYGDTSAKHSGILGLLISESVDMVWAHEHEIYGNDNHTGLFDRTSAIESRTGAIERQIGTLPAGYDSVGAALTAIKGIAEDAKAAALAAIPDPKQEGSSGKFVLTVDIVGDNATYRWEKIDREGETTTE